jgi:hypothetical protein
MSAAARGGREPTIAGVARATGVDRSFLYWYRDLLQHLYSAAAAPTPEQRDAAVNRTSLKTDLAAALERNNRLAARVRLLESRLSEALGEQVWSATGPSAPVDIDGLERQIAAQERQVLDLKTSWTSARRNSRRSGQSTVTRPEPSTSADRTTATRAHGICRRLRFGGLPSC